MTLTEKLDAWRPQMLSILRIMAALLFIQHGTEILFNFPHSAKPLEGFHMTQHSIGGMMEFFGGVLVALGLFTRPAAFLLSGEMAVAYFQYHPGKGFFPIQNGGDPTIMYSFIFLYLVFAGPGAWALDNLVSFGRPRPINIDAVA